MMTPRAGVGAVLCLAAAGCGSLWDRANQGAARRDIHALLRIAGVETEVRERHLIGTTRNGYCEVKITPEQVTVLKARFGLEAAAGTRLEGGCKMLAACTGARIWRTGARTDALRLPDGTAFVFLEMFQAADSSGVCVQFSYAYG